MPSTYPSTCALKSFIFGAMSSELKVAVFTDGLFPDVIGGMQKHSFFLVEFLARNGVEVDLYYTAKTEKNRKAFENFSDEAKSRIHEIYVPFPKGNGLPGHYIKSSYSYSISLYNRLQKRPPVALIYAQGFTGWHSCKMRANKKLEIPVLVNLHGLEMYQPAFGVRAKFEQYLLRAPADYLLRHSDYAYSLGGRLTDILRKRIPESRIIEQSIGIDSSWLISNEKLNQEPEPLRKFIFVGRYEKRKGLDLLNEVMADSDSANVEFHLVGPIDRKVRVKKESVHYHGLVQGEDEMRKLLDSCEVLVCPSHAEGMPTVIIEAMARGLAVIATDVGAVSELVSPETGWLIEPGKIALSEAISAASTAEGLTEKRKAALQLIRNRFTWDTVVANTLNDFENVLEGRKQTE